MSETNVKNETFAEYIERLKDQPVPKAIKEWLEKKNRSLDLITGWSMSNDIIDVSEDYADGWKHFVQGPYFRIKLNFSDGTSEYGKYPHRATSSDLTIQEDKEENWGYVWERRKR